MSANARTAAMEHADLILGDPDLHGSAAPRLWLGDRTVAEQADASLKSVSAKGEHSIQHARALTLRALPCPGC